jgi:hypothetical protein
MEREREAERVGEGTLSVRWSIESGRERDGLRAEPLAPPRPCDTRQSRMISFRFTLVLSSASRVWGARGPGPGHLHPGHREQGLVAHDEGEVVEDPLPVGEDPQPALLGQAGRLPAQPVAGVVEDDNVHLDSKATPQQLTSSGSLFMAST